jgi:16S rRNA (cytosine967-C5)-methyltransferase
MAISAARTAAFDILLRVEREDAYASELLHSSQHEKLAPIDHRLAMELVMGVERWRSWLDERIAAQSSQPLEKLDREVLTALRLAAYQLAFLSRVPARAAVHESAELVKRARKRSAVSFVNAVLRKLAAAPMDRPQSAENAPSANELAAATAHPLWLAERWTAEYGFAIARRICEYDQQIPETAIRMQSKNEEEGLRREGVRLKPGALLKSARRVVDGDVTKSRAFREGRVTIQDEGSQLVAKIAGSGTRILDCCAAPGGKTRVLAEQNPQAAIVALELHPHRAALLRQRVTAENVEVRTADVREFAGHEPFHLVLADVPCTGTGTLARHPEIKWRLKPQDLTDLPGRQLEILRAAMKQAAPQGRVVYSTCSLEPEENFAVVEKALAENAAFRLLDCGRELDRLAAEGELAWSDPQSLLSGPCLRTIPGVQPSDGFFAAILARS